MKEYSKLLTVLLFITVLMTGLSGCVKGHEESENQPSSVSAADAVTSSDKQPDKEEVSKDKHTVGERYESTIMLEGMEEPVMAQWLECEATGVRLEWHYEDFEYSVEDGCDRFTWLYSIGDELPTAAMTITRVESGAQELVERLQDELAERYEEVRRVEDMIGEYDATSICGSLPKEGMEQHDVLCYRYVIDRGESCFVAELGFTIEMAEGVGGRMYSMLSTIVLPE